MQLRKQHRFFISKLPTERRFVIEDPRLLHQLTTVLRYDVGDTFIVFDDGSDDSVVSVVDRSKRAVTVERRETIVALPHPRRALTAAVAITKRDTFELVVQKLTELGVDILIPLLTNRTVKHQVRMERLELIALEATEQSGRNTIPRITEPFSLAACIEQSLTKSIVWDPQGDPFQATSIMDDASVIMYVGPEGGWSDEERTLFTHRNILRASLGHTILRTETAAIVGAYELLRTP